MIDYYMHPTFYDTSNADRDLGALGIRCPLAHAAGARSPG